VTTGLEAIELDLSETTFVDSFGLGALVTLYKTARERSLNGGPVVRVLHPRPPVQQVFELTRMHHIFEIVLRNGHGHVNGEQQPAAVG
jgi:anti-sigma B factor antagonist